MSYTDILKRIEPKYFGTYIRSGDLPGTAMLERDETEEELTGCALQALDDLLEPLEFPVSEPLRFAALDLAEACEHAAFLNGLRAGARLVLRLTDDRPIFY